MKGTIFQKPFEFNLRVEGETWAQGDPISGSLIIRNHSGEPVSLSDTRVLLGYADLRHVRAKSPDAFEILQTFAVPAGDLAGGAEVTIPWVFQTDRNSPITDTVSSLFLLYGAGSSYEKVGQLQLAITPFPVILDFIKILQISFRFVVKTQKFTRGAVEIKMAPPEGGKAFSHVEQLVLRFAMKEDHLEVEYGFKVKKIEATAANVTIGNQVISSSHTYRPDQLRTSSGRFNHDEMEVCVREVVAPFEAKTQKS